MKKNNLKSVLHTGRIITKISYRECPAYLILRNLVWIAYAAVQCLFIVTLQKMYSVAGREGFKWEEFVKEALFFGLILILSEVLLAVTNVMTEDVGFVIQKNFAAEVHEKVKKISPVKFEDNLFLDGIKKAQEGIENATYFTNVLAMIVFYHIPYLMFVSIYLVKQKPILILLMVMIFIPILIMQGIKMRIYSKVADKTANTKRVYDYYEKCLCGIDYFKENRMLGAIPYFRKKYVEALQQFQGQIWKTTKTAFWISIFLEGVTFLGYLGTIAFMVVLVCRKELSVSIFYAVFTSFGSMFEIIQSLLCFYVGKVSEQFGNAVHLVQFLNYEEAADCKENKEDFEKIELSHISFTYPGSLKKAINDISFRVKKGETIAIVGENGSGKSTLVKLLAGIYEPDEGKISYESEKEKYQRNSRSKTSAVFQNFGKYKLTLEENISFGKSGFDRKQTIKKIERLQLNIGKTKENELFDTVLSNEFGGIDLSGGQWQKVAILRGMNKEYNLLFLDEPTSAIDPVEESNMYHIFKEMSQNTTSFIVTHRLGVTKIADRIVFLENGRIKEVGTHEELMYQNGSYAKMWKMQASAYTN